MGVRARGGQEEVEEGEEDVEVGGGAGMVLQMVAAGGKKEAGEPAVHMNAPVNLFVEDKVDGEAEEHAGAETATEETFEGEGQRRIEKEDEDHDEGGSGEIDVACFVGSAHGSVVKAVAVVEEARAPVEQEAVEDVFKGIGVEDSGEKSQRQKKQGVGAETQGKPGEGEAAEGCGERVVAFDEEAASSFGGADLVSRFHFNRTSVVKPLFLGLLISGCRKSGEQAPALPKLISHRAL
jgi:hypothetical protein